MLLSNLSAYFEYAEGFLAPSLTVLYVAKPGLSTVAPERSTNYQAGLVYHGSKLSLDIDVYKIDFTNKFASFASSVPGEGTVWVNIGGATYKGVEGQVTYALTPAIAVFANGSINSAKSTDTGFQIAQAPKSTAAGGVIYKHGPIRFSLIDKYTGPQSSTGNGVSDIRGYNTAVIAGSYDIGPARFGIEAVNALDSQKVTQINGSQIYYQTPRSVSGDVTLERRAETVNRGIPILSGL
jgi:iron complex outermembrane receptor protein